VVWGIDGSHAPFRVLFGTSWGLCVAGLLFAIPVIWMRIHDTEVTEADFADSDKHDHPPEGEEKSQLPTTVEESQA